MQQWRQGDGTVEDSFEEFQECINFGGFDDTNQFVIDYFVEGLCGTLAEPLKARSMQDLQTRVMAACPTSLEEAATIAEGGAEAHQDGKPNGHRILQRSHREGASCWYGCSRIYACS